MYVHVCVIAYITGATLLKMSESDDVSDHIKKSFTKVGLNPLNRMAANHRNTKRDAMTALQYSKSEMEIKALKNYIDPSCSALSQTYEEIVLSQR